MSRKQLFSKLILLIAASMTKFQAKRNTNTIEQFLQNNVA